MERDWFEYAKKLEGSVKHKEAEIERLKNKKGVLVTKEKFKEWTEKEKIHDETNFNWHAEKMRANIFEDAGKILQSTIESQAKEIERLKRYAQHKEDCGHWTGWPKGCTCGLDELLKEVK